MKAVCIIALLALTSCKTSDVVPATVGVKYSTIINKPSAIYLEWELK